jgi:hypothetical protein
MREHNQAYNQWVRTRNALSVEMAELKHKSPYLAKNVRANLMGVHFFEKPDQIYAEYVEPLPGKDDSELHYTSGGQLRGPVAKQRMKDYLDGTGRRVLPEHSSKTVPPADVDVEKAFQDNMKIRIAGLDALDEMLRDNAKHAKPSSKYR